MNIDKFRYFLELTQTLNYTEAAERLFTTQSNVSKQILSLERELNTCLFCRKHRKITLTPAGIALIPYAEKLLSDYIQLKSALLPFQHSEKQTLIIGAIPVMAHYNMASLITTFQQHHSNTLLEIKEIESIYLLQELNKGSIDFAYLRLFEDLPSQYESLVIEQDYFVAVLPQSHPLADKKLIHLIDLKHEIFLQLDEHTQLISQIYSLCEQSGFTPKIGYTGTHIYNILDFISKGMGISLMMRKTIMAHNHLDVVIIPLDLTVYSNLAFVRLTQQHHSLVSNDFWNSICSLTKKNKLSSI